MRRGDSTRNEPEYRSLPYGRRIAAGAAGHWPQPAYHLASGGRRIDRMGGARCASGGRYLSQPNVQCADTRGKSARADRRRSASRTRSRRLSLSPEVRKLSSTSTQLSRLSINYSSQLIEIESGAARRRKLRFRDGGQNKCNWQK